jgi:hypothetical protein
MNISVENISVNISDEKPVSSSFYHFRNVLSQNNLSHISAISNYYNLEDNWDTYGAKKPNGAAIVKAINFIYWELNPKNKEVFFSAPTPDGDILIELKNASSNLEIVFSGEEEDRVIASCKGEFHAEAPLNETTFLAYLKWLH